MVTLFVICSLVLACGGKLFAISHSEVYAGFAIPTGVASNHNSRADELDIGSFGTTINLVGQFPFFAAFLFSPSATFLATSGTTSAVELEQNNTLDFRQGDLAMDLLWGLPPNERMRIGGGIAYGWWNAATKQKIDYYRYEDPNSQRYARGQAWMARAVASWFLRDPRRAGVSLRGMIALPVTTIMDETAWAAAGYVGVGVGFSMPLR